MFILPPDLSYSSTLFLLSAKPPPSSAFHAENRVPGLLFRGAKSKHRSGPIQTSELSNSASFVAAFTKAREKYGEVSAIFPSKDIRAALLGTTLEAYENVVTLIIGAELNLFHGDTTPLVASARMRKLFLRKIISGELDTDGRAFLDYLLGQEAIQKTSSSSHTKIPLPSVNTTSGAKAHSFPLQVSIQTQEFIQAVLFYAMFVDIAAGNYVRLPNALDNIEQELFKEGLDKKLWDNGWSYLQRYHLFQQHYISKCSDPNAEPLGLVYQADWRVCELCKKSCFEPSIRQKSAERPCTYWVERNCTATDNTRGVLWDQI